MDWFPLYNSLRIALIASVIVFFTGIDVYKRQVLPRIAAGVEVTKKDLAHMGNGGFCLGCKTCHYPNCGFGKGV